MRWIAPDDLSRPGDCPFVVLAHVIGYRLLQSDSASLPDPGLFGECGRAEHLATLSGR